MEKKDNKNTKLRKKNIIPKDRNEIEKNQKPKHTKRIVNNFHNPYLVQSFFLVENGRLSLVLKLTYLSPIWLSDKTPLYCQKCMTTQKDILLLWISQFGPLLADYAIWSLLFILEKRGSKDTRGSVGGIDLRWSIIIL